MTFRGTVRVPRGWPDTRGTLRSRLERPPSLPGMRPGSERAAPVSEAQGDQRGRSSDTPTSSRSTAGCSCSMPRATTWTTLRTFESRGAWDRRSIADPRRRGHGTGTSGPDPGRAGTGRGRCSRGRHDRSRRRRPVRARASPGPADGTDGRPRPCLTNLRSYDWAGSVSSGSGVSAAAAPHSGGGPPTGSGGPA